MKKFLIILLSVIIVIAIAFSFGWHMLPSFISGKLSKEMGVKVEILSISNPFSDVSVDGITIGNPKGSILKKALSVQALNTDMKLTKLLNKQVVIDNMELNNIYLGLEFNSKYSPNGNWTHIIGNMQPTEPPSKEGSSKSVVIKKLVLRNLKIDLVYKSNPGQIISVTPIEYLEVRNVGSEGSNLTEQIASIVLREMLKQVFSVRNLSNMLENLILPQGAPTEMINPFRLVPGDHHGHK